MFEPDLEASDILFDLLNECQMPRQFCQSWIWRDPWRIERCGTCGDQDRIERVVFGATQMHPAKRFNLDRLQHQHGEARRTQVLHYAAFITAGRFDADAHDADFDQVGRRVRQPGKALASCHRSVRP